MIQLLDINVTVVNHKNLYRFVLRKTGTPQLLQSYEVISAVYMSGVDRPLVVIVLQKI